MESHVADLKQWKEVVMDDPSAESGERQVGYAHSNIIERNALMDGLSAVDNDIHEVDVTEGVVHWRGMFSNTGEETVRKCERPLGSESVDRHKEVVKLLLCFAQCTYGEVSETERV